MREWFLRWLLVANLARAAECENKAYLLGIGEHPDSAADRLSLWYAKVAAKYLENADAIEAELRALRKGAD